MVGSAVATMVWSSAARSIDEHEAPEDGRQPPLSRRLGRAHIDSMAPASRRRMRGAAARSRALRRGERLLEGPAHLPPLRVAQAPSLVGEAGEDHAPVLGGADAGDDAHLLEVVEHPGHRGRAHARLLGQLPGRAAVALLERRQHAELREAQVARVLGVAAAQPPLCDEELTERGEHLGDGGIRLDGLGGRRDGAAGESLYDTTKW